MRYEIGCVLLGLACVALGCGGSSPGQSTAGTTGGSSGDQEKDAGGATTGARAQGLGGSPRSSASGTTEVSGQPGASGGLPGMGSTMVGGGSALTSGSPGSGGAKPTGGGPTMGGAASTTAETVSGGSSGVTDGGSATGGNLSGAGSTNVGEATVTSCDDQSTINAALDGANSWEATEVPTVGGAKSYFAFPNWRKYTGQVVNVAGLSFTISDPTQTVADASEPAGYPSFFVGGYNGYQSLGSNLPKLVSSLTTIPTVMATNALSRDASDVAAVYQLVFTSAGAALDLDHSQGGAYLEIWLYKPTARQPVGQLTHSARPIDGANGSWNVWMLTYGGPPYITYVSATSLGEVGFDVNAFIRDSVKNSYGVKSTMYLNVIFGGFQIWAGGDGMQMKRFCVHVN